MARRGRTAAVITAGLGLLVVLAGCGAGPDASPPDDRSESSASQTTRPAPSTERQPDPTGNDGSTGTGEDGGDSGRSDPGEESPGIPDGPEDPRQEREEQGRAVAYGGPDVGDQGVDDSDPNVWCGTLVVFWGDEARPAPGVAYSFDTAVPDKPGVEIEPGPCGPSENPACLDVDFASEDGSIFCGLRILPTADFDEDVSITFEGTLTCPSQDECDRLRARDLQPPTIFVAAPKQADPATEREGTPEEDGETEGNEDPDGDTPPDQGSDNGSSPENDTSPQNGSPSDHATSPPEE